MGGQGARVWTRAGATAVLKLAVDVRAGEVRALLWSFAYFFCLLSGYYVLRPLREQMGIASGVENLQWLFTGTFVAMLLAVPVFGAIVARFPRRRFLPLVYHFFALDILIFFLLFRLGLDPVALARAFFIWVSLFNLFVVSVFWSFMADLFRNEQGRRLFGFIAAGGTAGALVGPGLTALLAVPIGPVNLLLLSGLLLEAAVVCIYRLLRAPGVGRADRARAAAAPPPEETIGGSVIAGPLLILRSPFLAGICLYILLFTTTSTFLYFQQAHIVAGALEDPAEQTRLFAVIDLLVGVLTLLVQVFLTGRFIAWLGVGAALAFVPALTLLGFLALAAAPALLALVAIQVLRRAANFALSKPGREILFTVVGREEKYKSKNFVDTMVYRGGDAASGWAFAGLAGAGLELSAIALVAAPLSALWLAVGLLLGRRQERLALAQAPSAP